MAVVMLIGNSNGPVKRPATIGQVLAIEGAFSLRRRVDLREYRDLDVGALHPCAYCSIAALDPAAWP
jgi:hypothetical protein